MVRPHVDKRYLGVDGRLVAEAQQVVQVATPASLRQDASSVPAVLIVHVTQHHMEYRLIGSSESGHI
jgi:RNase P/RNase MRP subunit p29